MCEVISPADFSMDRQRGNDALLRFSASARSIAALDAQAYQGGALGAECKEFMGLAISFARDCESCVFYHLEQLIRFGVTDEEMSEAFDVVLAGCGSAAFPLARRALDFLGLVRDQRA